MHSFIQESNLITQYYISLWHTHLYLFQINQFVCLGGYPITDNCSLIEKIHADLFDQWIFLFMKVQSNFLSYAIFD